MIWGQTPGCLVPPTAGGVGGLGEWGKRFLGPSMLTFGRGAAFFTSGQLSVPLVRHALAATGLLKIRDVWFFGMELLCQLGAMSRQRYRVATGRIAR